MFAKYFWDVCFELEGRTDAEGRTLFAPTVIANNYQSAVFEARCACDLIGKRAEVIGLLRGEATGEVITLGTTAPERRTVGGAPVRKVHRAY